MKFRLFALAVAAFCVATVSGTGDAQAAYYRCAATWADAFANFRGPSLEGGIRPTGLGAKGAVDFANGDLYLDAYQLNVGYLGTATADDTGAVTFTGSVTNLTPMAIGTNCSDPNTFVLSYLLMEVGGAVFPVFSYP